MRQWIGIAALALAACNGGGEGDGNESGSNSAAAGNSGKSEAGRPAAASGGAAAAMQAGEWEITTQVTGVDGPNVSGATPQGAIPPQTRRSCLTQEELARPGGIAAGGTTNASGCRAEGNSENGRIRSTIRCEGQGGRIDVTTTGTSTATSLDLNVETRVAAAGQTMNSRARITGRRLGDCPA